MTGIFNQQAPFPIPTRETDPSGGISIDPVVPAPAELPVAGTFGPGDGTYEVRNVGINRPLGASLGDDGVVAVLGIAAFQATKWHLTRVGDVFRFRQRSTGRFVESHPGVVVTSATGESSAGIWASDGPIRTSGQPPLRIMQLAPNPNGTGLGEAQFGDHNCFVGGGIDGKPDWVAEPDAQGIRLRNIRTGRFLDAHDVNSFRVVTRPRQANATQIFDVDIIGGVYELQHESMTFLDAFDGISKDVITVPGQSNLTQKWGIVERSDRNHTLQQTSSGRYMSITDRELVGFDAEVATTATTAETLFQQFKINPR